MLLFQKAQGIQQVNVHVLYLFFFFFQFPGGLENMLINSSKLDNAYNDKT